MVKLIFNKAGKKIQWKKDSLSNKWFWENLDSNVQKNETGPLSYTIHKNKFKMDETPKYEIESIKILEENISTSLFDLGHSNFLLYLSPEARETKGKKNYWDLIRIKSFSTDKGNNQEN